VASRIRSLVIAGLFAGTAVLPADRVLASEPAPPPNAGVMLVAARAMAGSYFEQSVVLLLQHDDRGSLGVIVNRRTDFQLEQLLPELPRVRNSGHAIYLGGPVATDTLLLLMRREPDAPGIQSVLPGLSFSLERNVLESLLERRKPSRDLRVYAGYAGWGHGQLAHELAAGAWRVMRADTEMLFRDDPDTLWDELIDRLDPPGIRVENLPIRAPAAFRYASLYF